MLRGMIAQRHDRHHAAPLIYLTVDMPSREALPPKPATRPDVCLSLPPHCHQQYAHGVNKGTLAKNVAKVEAKEKELAEAKAKAKVPCPQTQDACLPPNSAPSFSSPTCILPTLSLHSR